MSKITSGPEAAVRAVLPGWSGAERRCGGFGPGRGVRRRGAHEVRRRRPGRRPRQPPDAVRAGPVRRSPRPPGHPVHRRHPGSRPRAAAGAVPRQRPGRHRPDGGRAARPLRRGPGRHRRGRRPPVVDPGGGAHRQRVGDVLCRLVRRQPGHAARRVPAGRPAGRRGRGGKRRRRRGPDAGPYAGRARRDRRARPRAGRLRREPGRGGAPGRPARAGPGPVHDP